MKKHITRLPLLLLQVMIVLQCAAQPCLDTTVYSGNGTFYTVGGSGHCSFPVPALPIHIAAINSQQYDSAVSCGGCIEVTGPEGTITASIEDECFGCTFGSIDFSPAAFDSIADPLVGIVSIQWKYVPCPVAGTVKLFISSASNPYYINMQVRNHRYPVTKVEFSSNGSSFTEMTRGIDNMFSITSSTAVDTPLAFRITDVIGNVITENDVPFITGVEITGLNQFPVCQIPSAVNTITPQQLSLNIYPNPSASGEVNIEHNYRLPATLNIYDVTGRCISSGHLLPAVVLPLSLSGKGIYFVQASFSNGAKEIRKMVTY